MSRVWSEEGKLARWLDVELAALDGCAVLLGGLDRALRAVIARAEEHRDTVCIGRTHGVHAEPTTFGWKLAGWAFELDRARERVARALETNRVGQLSGTVGTYAQLAPEVERSTCERLGLEPDPLSTQVIARDRHAELLCALALCATSLERFATEIRHLARTEVGEVEEPFGKAMKGSSAMPHKRNPKVAERICGLARVVRAAALLGLENVPLWHERDISNSAAERVAIPDAFLALDYMLDRFVWIVEGLVVRAERMLRNLEATRGLVFSHRLLLALVESGMGRDDGVGPRTRLPRACSRRRRGARTSRPRRRLRPCRNRPSRRRSLRAPAGARAKGGTRPCLKPRPTSPAARSASCTRSTTIACSSSPATGSRHSTSCCRRKSPTKAAC